MNLNKLLKKIALPIFFLYSSFSYAQLNYEDALAKSILFFDANKCGPEVSVNNAYSWRSACHNNDGSEVGMNLSGGYHDAGDHVKFGLPQTWSAATLGWALYEYRESFDEAGATAKMLSALKHFTDYFLRCHINDTTFYYHTGDPNIDHAYWGAPEVQTGPRPVIAATPSKPASDVCGEAAAALALMYLNYKDIDAAYATQCLNAAKQIFELGKNYVGRSDDGVGSIFYRSHSHLDDLSWGAIWLSIATGNQDYLAPVDGWIDVKPEFNVDNYHIEWGVGWENVFPFVLLKMYQLTGIQKYHNGLVYNLEWFRNKSPKTVAGLPRLSNFGALGYVAAEAGLGYLAAQKSPYQGYLELAHFSTDYILGKNPRNSSYITNWGSNPPIHPHHRANEPVRGGVAKGLIGGLVGGPNNQDQFNDDVTDYQGNAISLDVNASLILALAGRIHFKDHQPKKAPKVKLSVLLSASSGGYPVSPIADATDEDGSIAKVEFFSNLGKIAEDSVAPYTTTWYPPGNGTYSLFAKATDNDGLTGISSLVILPIPLFPALRIISPRTGMVFDEGSAIPIITETNNSEGTFYDFLKVEFYANGIKIGEDVTSPYSYSWTNAPIGPYIITVKSIGPLGNSNTSIGIQIKVRPRCSFGTPASTALPTIASTFNKIHVLGTDGPDLSNVTHFTINWDLSQNGLWQLSFNTNNGIPTWWKDLRSVATARFNQPNPDITFTNSGFPGLDGQYWISKTQSNIVLASKTGGFTIYFSNSSVPPTCSPTARMSFEEAETSHDNINVYPMPFTNEVYIDVNGRKDIKSIELYSALGQKLETVREKEVLNQQKIRLAIKQPGQLFILRVQTTDKIIIKSIIR